MIQVLKDEQNKSKLFYEKQCQAVNEQCLREKNEIKTVRRARRSSSVLSTFCVSAIRRLHEESRKEFQHVDGEKRTTGEEIGLSQ